MKKTKKQIIDKSNASVALENDRLSDCNGKMDADPILSYLIEILDELGEMVHGNGNIDLAHMLRVTRRMAMVEKNKPKIS